MSSSTATSLIGCSCRSSSTSSSAPSYGPRRHSTCAPPSPTARTPRFRLAYHPTACRLGRPVPSRRPRTGCRSGSSGQRLPMTHRPAVRSVAPRPTLARWEMTIVVRPAMNGASDAMQLTLGLDVEVRRRLVEDQDRGVLDDRPGDRQALTLAAAQQHAVLADPRLVAVGQRRDERRGCGPAGRRRRSSRRSRPRRRRARLSRIVALNRWTSCGTTPSIRRTSSARSSWSSWPPIRISPSS